VSYAACDARRSVCCGLAPRVRRRPGLCLTFCLARVVLSDVCVWEQATANTDEQFSVRGDGVVTVSSGLTVTAGGLSVSAGGATITGALSVSEASTLTGAVTLSSTLSVGDSATIGGESTLSGAVTMDSTLNV
jgi:hypothetical protein